MLYVVGVNHGYQFVGRYPSKNILVQISEKAGKEYEEPFYGWLQTFLRTNNIKIIFEEWTLESEDAWKEKYTEPIVTSAQKLSESNKIPYIQVDQFPQPVDLEGNVDHESREKSWVTKILESFPKSQIALFVVGDKHCDNLREKLARTDIEVKILRQSELELELVPPKYNDTILSTTNGFKGAIPAVL